MVANEEGLLARKRKRDGMGVALAVLNRVAGAKVVDRLNLRGPLEKGIYQASRTGFRTVGAASRAFKPQRRDDNSPVRPAKVAEQGLFDLTPDDEQQMIREAVSEFAVEQLRPAAAEADTTCVPPQSLLARADELGMTTLTVPEELGGAGTRRSAITNVLVAEALAKGDMGLAVACLAPSAVSNALVLWGDADQQATYLPAFVGQHVPAAALAILEPRPLFDPLAPRTTARKTSGGYVLNGLKSLVPRAAEAELFVVAAQLEGVGPSLFLIESGTNGVLIESEPAMGLRGASMGRLVLDDVNLRASARLGGTNGNDGLSAYTDCVRLSRLGWCALAVGTSQAVLDYVVPYVNDRVAFGEPISHRQGVAFKVADIGIELDGMRLVTYRAASRAEQGRTFAREVALARRLCTDKGMAIGSDGVQLLGGHGFVKEHPVERWYRDLRAIGVMEGAVLV